MTMKKTKKDMLKTVRSNKEKEIIKLIKRDRLDEALKRVTKREITLLDEISNESLKSGKKPILQQTVKILTRMIELNPEDAKTYNNRGVAYAELSQYENAINDYTKAIEIDYRYAETYYNRGNSYVELNQYENAINDYTKRN